MLCNGSGSVPASGARAAVGVRRPSATLGVTEVLLRALPALPAPNSNQCAATISLSRQATSACHVTPSVSPANKYCSALLACSTRRLPSLRSHSGANAAHTVQQCTLMVPCSDAYKPARWAHTHAHAQHQRAASGGGEPLHMGGARHTAPRTAAQRRRLVSWCGRVSPRGTIYNGQASAARARRCLLRP